MSMSVKMSIGAASLGSVIQGNWGNYQIASDGTFTADTRDVSALLSLGCVYVNAQTRSYGQTPAVATATAGKFIASTSLATGAFSIAAQPDVPRQGQLVLGATSPALSAGTVTLIYTANDGSTQTDTFSAVVGLTATATAFTSKGLVHISSAFATGITGGGAPFIHLDSTSVLSVPVDFNAKDVTFIKETIDSGDETVGTPNTNTLASIQPTVVPNGTHTYGWMYTANTPDT